MSALKRRREGLPKFLYRCFDVEEHALDLIDGKVWVSTVKWLRAIDRARGDPMESTALYKPGIIDTNVDTPEMRRKVANLALMGIVNNGGMMKFYPADEDSLRIVAEPTNAFIVCTSTAFPSAQMRTGFGQFCVRIANPATFIEALHEAIQPIAVDGICRLVDYSGREYRGSESIPAHSHFLGPPGNQGECEFRMIWEPRDGAAVEPCLLAVPEVAPLCSMV